MTYSARLIKTAPLLPFIIPILCIILIKTSLFSENADQLSMAITFDLLITTPVLYFLIIRKRKIPNTTAVPVFILGIVIASVILPVEQQYHLSLVKTWFLPLVEISIIAYVIYTIQKVYRTIRKDKSSSFDFFAATKEATAAILPRKLVIPFATELSVFYYSFIAWKKRSLAKNEFSYHVTTSTSLVLGVFVFLIIIEASVVHLLLQQWSSIAAWILTILSVYGIFQIMGIARSLSKRPIVLTDDQLILKYGIMNEVTIPLGQIKRIEAFKKSVEKDEGYAHLSPFKDMEGHNVLIEVKEELKMVGFYGIKKPFRKVLVYLDKPEDFINTLKEQIISFEQSNF